jgi:hypothetical protein
MTRKSFASLFAILFVTAVASVSIVARPAPDQPRMQAARVDLNQARASLQRASSNKGGHRVKAIEYINAAIGEINRGIAFDRRHNHATLSAPPDQPNMQAALNHLNDAQRNLQAATSDKGGHRQKAMDYVGKAISEVNKGIAAGD